MEWNKLEPFGNKNCSICDLERQVMKNGPVDTVTCPMCIYREYGDEFIKKWVIDSGPIGEVSYNGGTSVSIDFGYGFTISLHVKKEQNTNSDNLIVEPNATVVFEGEKLCEIEAENWSKYAESEIRK